MASGVMMRINATVEYGVQRRRIVVPCGDGRKSVKWLGLVAAQRFIMDAAARGKTRLRDRRSVAPAATQLIPSGVSTADEPFFHPSALLCDVFEDGAEVAVALEPKVAVGASGRPLRSNWAIVAFSTAPASEPARRAALEDEYRKREARLAKMKRETKEKQELDNYEKGSAMRKMIGPQLLQMENLDPAVDGAWAEMNRQGLMDQFIRNPRDQDKVRRILRDHFLELSELFKFYSAGTQNLADAHQLEFSEFCTFARDVGVFGPGGFADHALLNVCFAEACEDGFLEDWALGIHQVLDKTAKGEAQAIKEEVYDKLAAAAESFKQAVAVALGDDAAKDVADQSMVEITRLVGSVAMSDNASTATATSREIGVLVQRAVVAKLGPDVVEKMTPAAIIEATATFWGTCERHLHNTFLDGAVKKEKKLLESLYAEKIAAMPADQRPTLDLTVICRAVAKAFGTGQSLYGKTLVETDWLPFVAAECKGKYMPAFKRTDRGVRQDDLTTSARRVWWLRPEIVRCLRQNAEKSENLLRSHLAMELSSQPIVAGLYARTLLDERFTQPWTFFAASTELDWDLTDMCKVHEATLAACQIPRSQWPQTWLNPDWDPYAVLMNVPAYREWRRLYLARKGVAEQRAEIFRPMRSDADGCGGHRTSQPRRGSPSKRAAD